MSGWLLLLAAAFLAFLGCASLSLSLPRNWLAVVGELPAARDATVMQRAGWFLLAAAAWPCMMRDGVGFAALIWPLLLAVSAFSIAMILSFRPALLGSIVGFYRRFRDSLPPVR